MTVNRAITNTLVTGDLTSDTFQYRTGACERRLLVTGVGTFDGATVTLYRRKPDEAGAEISIDTFTADFAKLVEPIISGDFYLVAGGGAGSEDITVNIAAGPYM